MASEESALLQLEKDCFYYFDGEKVCKFDFAKEIVADLDIVNEDLLVKSILKFIDDQKLNPAKFLFILSESSLFISDYKEKDQAKIEIEFNNFNSLIPFGHVLSKKYQIQDGIRMVATNSDLVEIIGSVFAQKGFARNAVVPSMLFGQVGVKRGLTVEDATFILKNQKLADGKGMLDPIPVLQQPVSEVFKVTKGKSTMLPMLLTIMGVMILGLVLLIVLRK